MKTYEIDGKHYATRNEIAAFVGKNKSTVARWIKSCNATEKTHNDLNVVAIAEIPQLQDALQDATGSMQNAMENATSATAATGVDAKALQDATERIEALQSQLQDATERNITLQSKFEAMQSELQEKIKNAKSKSQQHLQDLQQLRNNATTATKNATDATRSLQIATSEKEALQKRVAALQKELKTATDALQNAMAASSTDAKALQDATAKIEALQNTVQMQRSQLLNVTSKNSTKETISDFWQSVKTSKWIMGFIIFATFSIMVWEILGLPKFANKSFFSVVVVIVFSGTMSIAMVWNSFNPVGVKWIDSLVLFVFVGVEFASSANCFGLVEAFETGSNLQKAITLFLSLGLPVFSFKIAHTQSQHIVKFSLDEITNQLSNILPTYQIKNELEFKNDLVELLVK